MDTSIRITENSKRLELTLKGDRAVFKVDGGELSVRIGELIKVCNIHLERLARERAEELDSIVGE